MSKWFIAKRLAINLDKPKIKFITNNSPQCALNVGYNGKYIKELVNTKFLVLPINNHLNWANDIDKLIPKLSGVCYTFRSVFHFSNTGTLRSFVYFHSIMKYRIILGSTLSNRKKICALQKKLD
jgi:hypothetical protein